MKRFKMKVHVHIYVQQVPATDPKKGVTGHVAADENHNDSFYHFATQEIKRTLTAGQLGTARNYRTALNSLHTFCHNRDLGFEHITPRLIGSYEQWLKQKGICLNTISCYMRSLRSLYNKAAEQGLTERQHPFDQVYTGVERTAKRSISLTSLRRLQTLPLAAGTPHSLARDLFLFSLLAYGMPFVDMAFLKKSQIRNGYLTYYRHKTGRRIHIRLEAPLQSIIERYRQPAGDYLFPIIHSSEPTEAYRQYRTAIGYYNRLLKQLARRCDIHENLTSYTSRHSWASLAYESKVSLPVITQALGHATPQTTLIYIRDINSKALDRANRRIISKLL